ncbi:hypothetical protein Cylst_1870 [Cylindrospermum stagnale PCC 7417]|uniref:Uncharacterized protein n=1 Tax=Cylindrospermum stagnale PCC 7417 TaxID=56107 RepID=K9WXA5_9NOST|nr:hypothetical protein Cylst_1870 [Cylindrospermum stagnale PCC 7417]
MKQVGQIKRHKFNATGVVVETDPYFFEGWVVDIAQATRK